MNESEPSMKHRKEYKILSKPAAPNNVGMSLRGAYLLLRRQSVYRWHDLNTGFSTELGNLLFDVKGNSQVEKSTRKNTDAKFRGGTIRSSYEGVVMTL